MKQIKTKMTIVCLLFVGLASHIACHSAGLHPKSVVVPLEADTFGLSKDYQVSPYPVDNFGMFTAYQPPNGSSWNEGNQICATWSCLGVEQSAIPTDPTQRLTINGFADVGSGGTVSLSTDQQNMFGIKLLLPGLAKLIDIKGNVDWSKHVIVKLQLGVSHKRVLNRLKALDYLKNKLNSNQGDLLKPLKDAYDKGQLVLIVADLVVDSLDATITVDKKLNAGADAALSQAAQAQQLPVGKDANLNGKLERTTGGSYHLEVKNPVVLAVYPKQQPSPGNLGPLPPGADPWIDWKPVVIPLKRKFH